MKNDLAYRPWVLTSLDSWFGRLFLALVFILALPMFLACYLAGAIVFALDAWYREWREFRLACKGAS